MSFIPKLPSYSSPPPPTNLQHTNPLSTIIASRTTAHLTFASRDDTAAALPFAPFFDIFCEVFPAVEDDDDDGDVAKREVRRRRISASGFHMISSSSSSSFSMSEASSSSSAPLWC